MTACLVTMDLAEGDWVAEHVLTTRYLKSCGGIRLVRKCACQGGTCGRCNTDRHDICTTKVGFGGNPPVQPITWIQSRNGSAGPPVTWNGRQCRWVCPCDCPAPERAPAEQLGLFDLGDAS